MKPFLTPPLQSFTLLSLLASLTACSSGDTTPPAGSGGAQTGGTTSAGGAASGTGGLNPSGGTSSSGGTGNSATGGAVGSGGSATGSGGTTSGDGGAETGAGGGPDSTGGAGGSSSTGGTGSGGGGSTALFSSDFEADAGGAVMSGGPTWTTTLPTTYDSAGVVSVVDDTSAHSGSKSVYVKKGNDGQAFLQLTDASVFPFSASTIFVRTWIKVPEWPANHASWIEVGSVTNEESEIRLGAHQGVLQVNHWPGDQDQIADTAAMTPNMWHCLELSYEPGTKTLHVWLDESAIPELTVEGEFERGGAFDPAPPIDAVRFGAEIAGTEAWFDDIAVGTAKLGCQ